MYSYVFSNSSNQRSILADKSDDFTKITYRDAYLLNMCSDKNSASQHFNRIFLFSGMETQFFFLKATVFQLDTI